MANPQINPNTCHTLLQGTHDAWYGIVQIISIEHLKRYSPYEPDQYCVEISDGRHYLPAALAPSLNRLIRSGELRALMGVRVEGYTRMLLKSGKVTIILNKLTPLEEWDEVMGNPELLEMMVHGDASLGERDPAEVAIGLPWADVEPFDPVSYRTIYAATA